jgi:CheY-like chemotaxis protein
MKLAEARLKGWGCRVHQALHYQRGLQYLDTKPVDLVLMDLRMPGMDGYAVSKAIRKHEDERIRVLPIVALTADFSPEVEARLKACGIAELVIKPYAPEALSKALIRGLREAKNPQAAEAQADHAGLQPVLSLGRLWEDCNREYDMLEEMVRLFQNGVLEFLGALSIHSKSPDYNEIREAAHKVKAGLKLLQANAWLDRIEQIQELARSKTGAGKIRGHFESLAADFPHLEAALWEELNQFKPGT